MEFSFLTPVHHVSQEAQTQEAAEPEEPEEAKAAGPASEGDDLFGLDALFSAPKK
jgi:hypothetical protein